MEEVAKRKKEREKKKLIGEMHQVVMWMRLCLMGIDLRLSALSVVEEKRR